MRSDLIRPLPETLLAHAAESGTTVAFRDARRAVTYAELEARTARLAGHLASGGVGRGDRVAILLGNAVEVIEGYLAATRAAAVGVPLNPQVSASELDHLLGDSGARVVVTDRARAALVRRIAARDVRVLVTGEGRLPDGTESFEALARTAPAVSARDDLDLDEPAWMLYTSGTTGLPKGVLSTQRNALWSVASCYVPIPGLSAEDRVLWPLPLFHSLSHIAGFLAVVSVGATSRILDGFAADEVLAALREDRTTFLAGVPTVYHHLVAAARDTGFTAPDLRIGLVGGAVTTAALRADVEEIFGVPLLDAYGSTETCGSIAMVRPDGPRVDGSCGQPVPGLEVRLVDTTTGADTATGAEGEVWVRGPSVAVGYHRRPEETAAAFGGGWYRTGDLATQDGAGFLTVTGRIKELIIRGGENIHPVEVETVLRRGAGVRDVAVGGRPHPVLGEVPVAYVVPGPDGRDGLDPGALLAACRTELSPFKVPEEIRLIAEIPRTASGKVTRHLLLERPSRLVATGASHHEHLLRVEDGRLVRVPSGDTGPAAGIADPVLVTGADSAVAAAVATHLVGAHGVREVVLLSDWGQADGAGPLAEELRRQGARVVVVAGSPNDPELVRVAVGAAGGRFGTVVQTHPTADPGRVAAVLVDVAASAPETTLVVLTALAPGDGYGTAGAARALSEWAAARRGGGLPTTVLAVGPTALDPTVLDTLPDTTPDSTTPDSTTPGLDATVPLAPAELLSAFDAALDQPPGDSVILRLDERAAAEVPTLRHLVVEQTGPGSGEGRARLDGLTAAERRRTLVGAVRSAAAELLGVRDPADLRPDRPFRELGLSSLAAVRLRTVLAAHFGVTLSATAAFDHPTPDALADHLDEVLRGGRTSSVAIRERTAAPGEPIAIVAASCRLPGGVTSPEDLWRLVAEERDAIGDFPLDRGWDVEGLYDPEPGRPGRTSVRRGGFLYDVADFDADLFGISPREAAAADPQQRLLLELAWEAFERAGVDPRSLRGADVGTFTGVMHHDYASRHDQVPDEVAGYLGIGTAGSVASGRIAYTLGLEGPAITVDTACSSSLVALHLAVQSLRSGESTLALAGGAAVMATPGVFLEFSRQRALAPDGRCKAFADTADGTGWSEGAGLLLLERLSDARRLGHPVLAVVRGTAVNQDGASNGLTAPSGPSQERVIRAAWADAGLSGADVDLVEAHGTGTTLGDPIEAQALLATYGRERTADRPLHLGSLKSNIGHTQAAAGVAGIIKVIGALHAGTLHRTLHVDRPSAQVDWTSGAVELLTEARRWTAATGPRRAAVSSFGVSGTNAHVIVEEALDPAVVSAPRVAPAAVPWIVTGRGDAARVAFASRLRAALDTEDAAGKEHTLADVGWSLATARATLDHRGVVVASTTGEALAGLDELASGAPAAVVTGVADVAGRTVFVFPGQGAQWVGMGAELAESSPVFAEAVDEVAAALAPLVDWDLWAVLRSEPGAPSLERVDVLQPASFAVGVGLARLWGEFGIVPDAVVGHSQGEVVAAHVAGVLGLADAVEVVVARSRAIASGPAGHGGMLAVSLAEDEAVARARGRVELAAVNGPSAVVLAGERTAVADLAAELEADGVRARVIPVDYASHTAAVDPTRPEILTALAGIRPGRARIPFWSTVEDGWVSGEELDAGYWFRNLRRPVRFGAAVDGLVGAGFAAFVEVSPHPVLTYPIEAGLERLDVARAVVTGTLRRDDGGLGRFLRSAAALFVRGLPVDWAPVFAGTGAVRVDLPTYPFQRERFWLGSTAPAGVAAAGIEAADHPLLDAVVPLAGRDASLAVSRLSVRDHPWLADHVVDGAVLLPGTALLDAVAALADRLGAPVVEELTVSAPIVVPAAGAIDLQVEVGPEEGGRRAVAVHVRARPEEPWAEHATGTLLADTPAPRAETTAWPPAGEPVDVAGLYERLTVDYGPAFHAVRAVWRDDERVHAEITLPDEVDAAGYGLHPALLDAALHPVPVTDLLDAGQGARLAFSWAGVRRYATGDRTLHVTLVPAGPDAISLRATDPSGAPVLEVDRLVLRPVPAVRDDSLFEIAWVAAPGGDDPGELRLMAPDEDPAGPGTPVLVPGTGPVGPSVPERARAAGLGALTALARWLGDESVTDVVVAVQAGDPAGDVVAGLVRSAQSEHPGRIRLLELDRVDEAGVRTGLAVDGDEPRVAVRDGTALVPRLRRVQVPDARPAGLAGGAVLVTGATGGLGRLVARHLVTAHGVSELVLVTRSGVPDAQREELVRAGASVHVVTGDAADRAVLSEALELVGDRLVGVVHAAGVVSDGVLAALDAQRWDRVVRTKADAAWHLHELTAGRDLAAFVLFSSAASTFGGAGQANYAAGNAFLESLAARRRAAGQPATALAWGLWEQQAGMGGRLAEADLARMARVGTVALSDEEGLALFDRALAGDAPTLVPIRLDLAAVRASGEVPALLRELVPRRATVPRTEGLAGRIAGLPEKERAAAVLDEVRTHVADVLGHGAATAVDAARAFKDLGFDSLTGVELRNRLTASTGVRLPATVVFDHPTPEALAAHLLTELVGLRRGVPTAPTRRVATPDDDAVAIVAAGCRFPGGITSPDALWRFVEAGGDAIGPFPTDRGWDLDAVFAADPDRAGTTYVRAGGFLDDVAGFDAEFFGINPREALAMDPQQRLLLEVSWEALERAGIDPAGLRGSPTGVFVGTHGQDYGTGDQRGAGADEGYLVTGNAGSVLSGRIAYALGLEGPALTVDTACSSSLVALHLATRGRGVAGAGGRGVDHVDARRHRRVLPAARAGRGRALQGVRRGCRRLRDGRGSGGAAARAALRRTQARPSRAGGGARQRGEPGRRVERADGPERTVPGAGHPGRLGGRRPGRGGRRRRRGARDRHRARRPDRGPGAARHLRPGPCGRGTAADRVGQVEHRPHPGRRRCRGRHQDRRVAAARPVARDRARRPAVVARGLDERSRGAADRATGVGRGGADAAGGGVGLRGQRHQRARDPGGAAGPREARGSRAGRGAARRDAGALAGVGADRAGAGRAAGAARGPHRGASRPRPRGRRAVAGPAVGVPPPRGGPGGHPRGRGRRAAVGRRGPHRGGRRDGQAGVRLPRPGHAVGGYGCGARRGVAGVRRGTGRGGRGARPVRGLGPVGGAALRAGSAVAGPGRRGAAGVVRRRDRPRGALAFARGGARRRRRALAGRGRRRVRGRGAHPGRRRAGRGAAQPGHLAAARRPRRHGLRRSPRRRRGRAAAGLARARDRRGQRPGLRRGGRSSAGPGRGGRGARRRRRPGSPDPGRLRLAHLGGRGGRGRPRRGTGRARPPGGLGADLVRRGRWLGLRRGPRRGLLVPQPAQPGPLRGGRRRAGRGRAPGVRRGQRPPGAHLRRRPGARPPRPADGGDRHPAARRRRSGAVPRCHRGARGPRDRRRLVPPDRGRPARRTPHVCVPAPEVLAGRGARRCR
ncbi:Malonyl CoA-acyl carrier protein transacylase [Pseudonocardia sp. Ae505_Ps2]|nr:Malonyl CoA-acyl carrier protein transacylase [Pseudonocardia sp. Ae505_Ps2]